MIRTDQGQEFRSKDVNAYLKGQNIHHFYALNTEIEANYAERLIKTLKLFRYMLKTELNVISTSYKMQYTVTLLCFSAFLQSLDHCYNHHHHHPPPPSTTTTTTTTHHHHHHNMRSRWWWWWWWVVVVDGGGWWW